MDGLGFLGLAVEQRRNAATSGDCEISGPDTTARTIVVSSREDLEIARQVRELTDPFAHLGYRFNPAVIPAMVDYCTARMTHGSTLCRVAMAWVLAHTDRLAIDLPPRHDTATD